MKAIAVGLFVISCGLLAIPDTVSAARGVVISQLQTGDVSSASNEAVELYNNTDLDVDVSDWCVRYATATSLTLQSSPRYCFTPIDTQTKIFLSARSYGSIVTTGYVLPGGLSPDGIFSGSGMALSGGHVKLLDANGDILDAIGWGTATFAEGYVSVINPAPSAPTTSQVLSRINLTLTELQDTDNNRADFELKTPGMRTGGIYEVRIPVDLCGNLSDIQEVMPDGFGYDEAGNCESLSADQCLNIDLVQLAVPDTLLRDTDSNCYADVCPNRDGLQRGIPDGFTLKDEQCVELEQRPLWLSEILPNVDGSDTGYEFIELYNPNSEPVDLEGYMLQIGKNLETSYVVDSGTIPAHGYVVFYDDELGFTLLNTTSNLRLIAPAGDVVSEAGYSEPKDDESWALIGGEWRYTNRPTPLAENLPYYIEEGRVEGVSSVSACPAGKYRHPITNRCRNIETDTTMLVACDADEYRNPETNRCRKIASLAATLVPCNEGYERNLETNRCRKVDAVSSLAACQVGYERNPETNRCRKSNASAVTKPAVVPLHDEQPMLKNALIITVGVGAVGYGLYEWRSELRGALRKVTQALIRK